MRVAAPPALPPSQEAVERRVVLLGFTPFERHQLETVFRLAAARPLRYRLVQDMTEAEVAVADADQPEVMAQLHRRGLPAVLVGDCGVTGATRLARPINVAQIVRSLDTLMRQAPSSAPVRQVLDDLAQVAGRPPQQPRGRLLVVATEQVTSPLVLAPVQRAGVEIVRARSGAEAIERCRSARFDLVLIDAGLDGLDGYHACRTIKQRAEVAGSSPPPVVLLASGPPAVCRVRAEMAGADGLLEPPLDSAALLALLPGR